MARRVAGHARGRGLVAGARRRERTAAIRFRSSGRPPATTRSTATGSPRTSSASSRPSSCGWRSSPATSCRRLITRRSARKASRRSRSAPAPTWSTNTRATRSCASRPIPHYWGGKPAFETVIFKFVPDATTRVAEIESGSSDITLEMPYEEFDRLKTSKGLVGRGDADLGHRHDLHHQQGADARQERAPRGDHGDRQEGDRRPAAARLWRADRDAGSAGLFGLRSVDQDAIRSRRRRPNCSPPRATRRRSRSSSPSRRRAASSRKTTR